jgi:ribonuclease PH
MNGVMMALLDAGISMTGFFGSVTAAFVRNEETSKSELTLDPTRTELEKSTSVHTLVFEDQENKSPCCDSQGTFDVNEVRFYLLRKSLHVTHFFFISWNRPMSYVKRAASKFGSL